MNTENMKVENGTIIANSEVEPEVIDIKTIKTINKDGVKYAPKFTSEGMIIPIVAFNGTHNQVFNLLIGRDEIKKMLREYVPEILNELK